MSTFQLGFMGLALFTALISHRLPKAALWSIMIGAVYLASSYYWMNGAPYPSFFTGLLDCVLAAVIFISTRHYKERWQMWLGRVVQVMVLASLIYLINDNKTDHYLTYTIILEALNVLAFAIIGGTAITQWLADAGFSISGPMRRIRGFIRARCDTDARFERAKEKASKGGRR